MALANGNSPVFSLGGFQGAMAFFKDEPKITDAFVREKESIGAIMITTCMKELKDFSNQIMLPI